MGKITRRELTIGAAALAAVSKIAEAHPLPASAGGTGGGEKIAMVLYPGMTALDLIGPQYVLGGMMGAKVQYVAAKPGPVAADRGMSLVANASYADVPDDLDVLFVPGSGLGTVTAMQDKALLEFLADRGKTAKFVTSVCTGSLVLGAAGLLKGYRATSHWAFRDAVLPLLGATPVNQRFVVDRNRISGGGVTAGIDFGLRVLTQLRGEPAARITQLIGEYDPDPPYQGSPEKAHPDTVAAARKFTTALREKMVEAARTTKMV